MVDGMRIMDAASEEILKIIIDAYDGNEERSVQINCDIVPKAYQMSLSLELEKLMMYGVVTSAHLWISGMFEATLTPQGLSYFEDKEKAMSIVQEYEVDAKLFFTLVKKCGFVFSFVCRESLRKGARSAQPQMKYGKRPPLSVHGAASGYDKAHMEVEAEGLRVLLVDVDAAGTSLQSGMQKKTAGSESAEGGIDKEHLHAFSFHAEKGDGLFILKSNKKNGNMAQSVQHVGPKHDDVLFGKKVVRGPHRGFPDEQQRADQSFRSCPRLFDDHALPPLPATDLRP